MIEPLTVEFTVECSPEHAFEVWANKTSMWWPNDHSRSGESGLTVTFEPHTGGRIYERTPGGVEHDWGEIVAWEPPNRLVYLWHIAGDRASATEVEITFSGAGDGTRVTIVQTGWERLGATAEEMRRRNRHGWAGLIPHYTSAAGS